MEGDRVNNQDPALAGVGRHFDGDGKRYQDFPDQLQVEHSDSIVTLGDLYQPASAAVLAAQRFTLNNDGPASECPYGGQLAGSYLAARESLTPGFRPETISDAGSSQPSYFHQLQSLHGTGVFTYPTSLSSYTGNDCQSAPAGASIGYSEPVGTVPDRRSPCPVEDTAFHSAPQSQTPLIDTDPPATQYGAQNQGFDAAHLQIPITYEPTASPVQGSLASRSQGHGRSQGAPVCLPHETRFSNLDHSACYDSDMHGAHNEAIFSEMPHDNLSVPNQPLSNTDRDGPLNRSRRKRRRGSGSQSPARSLHGQSAPKKKTSSHHWPPTRRPRGPKRGKETHRPPPAAAHPAGPTVAAGPDTNADTNTGADKPARKRGARNKPMGPTASRQAHEKRTWERVCVPCNQAGVTCNKGDPPDKTAPCVYCRVRNLDCREAKFVKHIVKGTCFPPLVVHQRPPNENHLYPIFMHPQNEMTEDLIGKLDRAAPQTGKWDLRVWDGKEEYTFDLDKVFRDVRPFCQQSSSDTIQDIIDSNAERSGGGWSSYVMEDYKKKSEVVETMFRWLENSDHVTLSFVPRHTGSPPSVFDIDRDVIALIYRFLTRKLEVQGFEELKSKTYKKHNKNDPRALLHAAHCVRVLNIYENNCDKLAYAGAPGSSAAAAEERAAEVCRTLTCILHNLMKKVPPPGHVAWRRIGADEKREAERVLQDRPAGETDVPTERRDVEFMEWRLKCLEPPWLSLMSSELTNSLGHCAGSFGSVLDSVYEDSLTGEAKGAWQG